MQQQHEQHLEIILNSIADGVFTIDLDKNITSFNKAAEKITGIPHDQAIGQKCFEVFHSNICQESCALEKTLRTGKQIIDLKVNIINSRGETIPISVSTAVLKNKKGQIVGGVETFRDLSVIEHMRKELTKQYSYEDIISKNSEIQKTLSILPDIALSNSTVLIQGPSGSGKEVFARAIHNTSSRKQGPYIAVNCAALPDALLESELFGYVKGAFTDAKQDKPGRFSLAEGGTLFLDEIGDLSAPLQVKLLRVLQDGEYAPLGATKPVKADVRIIAATHRNLQQCIAEGSFREDLYYRINVIKIALPPLRERREDIPLLTDHFIRRFNREYGRRVSGISAEALQALMAYDFPGNIRELENIIEHGFVLCRNSVIKYEHLPQEFREQARQVSIPEHTSEKPLLEAQVRAIKKLLHKHNGHRGKTAYELGMDRSTLWRKMKKFGIID